MIVLANTTDHLQLQLGAPKTTNDLPFVCVYIDHTIPAGVTTSYVPGRNVGTTNGVTAVDCAATPTSTVYRQIKHLDVTNLDTIPQKLTVLYNANGTTYTEFQATLQVGDVAQYNDGEGWKVTDVNGNLKGFGPAGATGATGASGLPGSPGWRNWQPGAGRAAWGHLVCRPGTAAGVPWQSSGLVPRYASWRHCRWSSRASG